MKRKLEDYQCSPDVYSSTRSKKPYLIHYDEHSRSPSIKEYVSGSSVINWFMNDCLVDWYKLKKEIVDKDFKEENYLCEQGNKFESSVVEWIDKNVERVVKVADPSEWSVSNVYRTFDLMKEGTPIIHSASVRSKNLKLYGTADLLVRNDYIAKIFKELDIDTRNVNTIFNHPYFYYVVDIKWCTLYLHSDGQTIQNSGRFPGYKGQLSIYNNCIAEMQGYKPTYAFLLGRKVKFTHQGDEYVNDSPFKLPGIFKTNDTDF